MKTNNSIDIFKFIAACLVMSIHIGPFTSSSIMLNFMFKNTISRIAVPFFFTIAGYFLYNKINNIDAIKNYIKKLIKLYIIWSLIYFPIIFYTWIINDRSILFNIIIYIRNIFLIGTYVQLWYLPALIFSVIILSLLLKKFSLKQCLLLSGVLYLIGLLGESYYGLSITLGFSNLIDIFMKFLGSTRNGLFFGMFFVCLGMYIKVTYQNNKSLTFKYIALLISFILMIFEVFILKKTNFSKDYNMYFSLIPTTYFLILILLNTNINLCLKTSLRALSLSMYLNHMWIFLIYTKVVQIFKLTIFENSFIKYFIILALSITTHNLITYLRNIFESVNSKVNLSKIN